MNPDKMDYKFCADFLRYAYHVMGYDALIREANYIHHLYAPTAPSHVVPDTHDDVVMEQPNMKNVVIDNGNTAKIKYTRSQLSDDLRCTTIISNGTRCTFKRAGESERCGRHSIKTQPS